MYKQKAISQFLYDQKVIEILQIKCKQYNVNEECQFNVADDIFLRIKLYLQHKYNTIAMFQVLQSLAHFIAVCLMISQFSYYFSLFEPMQNLHPHSLDCHSALSFYKSIQCMSTVSPLFFHADFINGSSNSCQCDCKHKLKDNITWQSLVGN